MKTGLILAAITAFVLGGGLLALGSRSARPYGICLILTGMVYMLAPTLFAV